VPFTLEDLEADGEWSEGAQFVDLFSGTEPEALEESAPVPESESEAPEPETTIEPPVATPSLEDQTRKAFEDAYAQGEKAGYEMGLRRAESIAKRLEKQIDEVASFRRELSRRFERLATDLALVFAEALVLRECSEKRELVAGMIRKALDACEEKNELLIRTRSEDMKYVEGVASDRIKIVADDTLKEPGFIIETSMGDIDGRISVQIEELKNALAGYHGT
jgi:flagellar biosynthesis/type III secretory pathway protein FliH